MRWDGVGSAWIGLDYMRWDGRPTNEWIGLDGYPQFIQGFSYDETRPILLVHVTTSDHITHYLTCYFGWVVYPAMGPCLTTCYFGYFSVPPAFSPPFNSEPFGEASFWISGEITDCRALQSWTWHRSSPTFLPNFPSLALIYTFCCCCCFCILLLSFPREQLGVVASSFLELTGNCQALQSVHNTTKCIAGEFYGRIWAYGL